MKRLLAIIDESSTVDRGFACRRRFFFLLLFVCVGRAPAALELLIAAVQYISSTIRTWWSGEDIYILLIEKHYPIPSPLTAFFYAWGVSYHLLLFLHHSNTNYSILSGTL